MNDRTWTAFARFPDGTVEEVDVAARTEAEARALAEEELRRDYQQGWRIVALLQRLDGTYFM